MTSPAFLDSSRVEVHDAQAGRQGERDGPSARQRRSRRAVRVGDARERGGPRRTRRPACRGARDALIRLAIAALTLALAAPVRWGPRPSSLRRRFPAPGSGCWTRWWCRRSTSSCSPTRSFTSGLPKTVGPGRPETDSSAGRSARRLRTCFASSPLARSAPRFMATILTSRNDAPLVAGQEYLAFVSYGTTSVRRDRPFRECQGSAVRAASARRPMTSFAFATACPSTVRSTRCSTRTGATRATGATTTRRRARLTRCRARRAGWNWASSSAIRSLAGRAAVRVRRGTVSVARLPQAEGSHPPETGRLNRHPGLRCPR